MLVFVNAGEGPCPLPVANMPRAGRFTRKRDPKWDETPASVPTLRPLGLAFGSTRLLGRGEPATGGLQACGLDPP